MLCIACDRAEQIALVLCKVIRIKKRVSKVAFILILNAFISVAVVKWLYAKIISSILVLCFPKYSCNNQEMWREKVKSADQRIHNRNLMYVLNREMSGREKWVAVVSRLWVTKRDACHWVDGPAHAWISGFVECNKALLHWTLTSCKDLVKTLLRP